MDTKPCGCWDSKCMAPAIIRWALGMMFLVGGLAKLRMLEGFVNGYLVPSFSKTFLPPGLVAAYGHALPFVETLVGILLILGLYRTYALLLTALTLISLAFGQILLQEHATVAYIFVYLSMTAMAMWMSDSDRWVLGCQRSCGTGDKASTT